MMERGLLTLHPGLPHDSRVSRSARDLRHRSYISLTGQLRPARSGTQQRCWGCRPRKFRVWRGRSCLAHSLTRLLAGVSAGFPDRANKFPDGPS
jgi:hypothetical protein